MKKLLAAVFGALAFNTREMPDVIPEISARRLFLETYCPAVSSNNWGDRSKYTPEKCRQLREERGVGKRKIVV